MWNAGFLTMKATSAARDEAGVGRDGSAEAAPFSARAHHRNGISAKAPRPTAIKLHRQLNVASTTAMRGTIRNCPPVAPEVAMPVASPRLASNRRAMAVETTWVATMPKPMADMPPNATRNTNALLVAETARHPALRRARPTVKVTRTPCRSMKRPAKGATAAITSNAVAATPETKLRDQPSSCPHIGMTSPSVARAEKASASARKPKPTTSQARLTTTAVPFGA